MSLVDDDSGVNLASAFASAAMPIKTCCRCQRNSINAVLLAGLEYRLYAKCFCWSRIEWMCNVCMFDYHQRMQFVNLEEEHRQVPLSVSPSFWHLEEEMHRLMQRRTRD